MRGGRHLHWAGSALLRPSLPSAMTLSLKIHDVSVLYPGQQKGQQVSGEGTADEDRLLLTLDGQPLVFIR